MDRLEFEKDLIAILLVVQSAHDKNKLLFKYEQVNNDKREPEPASFHTCYSIVIAKDFDLPSAKDEDPPRTTFRNFDETTLSILTAPNSYDTHAEVQVDDVVFVGHTLDLTNNTNLKSFAVFFVLRAIAKASVILSYQEMSQRIGTALRCEEQRAQYLNTECGKLLGLLQQHVEPDDHLERRLNEEERVRENRESRERIYATMANDSALARTLKQIFIDLKASGEIKVTINNWLNVSCCLPHRSIALNCPLEIDLAFNVLSRAAEYLKPYYGLLLVIDAPTLLASLPTDGSSTLKTLVQHLRSSYSMSRLSIETGVPLTQIYSLVSHLLYWGRAKLIYPLCDDNIYIISPDADISKQGSLSKLYQETFQDASNYPTLQEALAEYSDAIPFYDHLVRNDTEPDPERFQCAEWLLRHRLLVQVHYYYYLLVKDDNRHDFKDEYRQRRKPYASNTFEPSASKSQRHSLASENIDIRGSLLSSNSFDYSLASSTVANSLSQSSVHHSRSTDTLKNITGTSQDDVFDFSSISSSLAGINNQTALDYLPQVCQALPYERPEFQRSVAAEMKDAKKQHALDFLRIIKYLDGTHHLDEIALLENMTRLQVLTIIEKFNSMVVRALHPDPNPVLQI